MRARIERASRVRAPVMCPTIKRPWLSRVIYIGGSRAREKEIERERNIYIYSSAGILLLATELPAAVCHVYVAATQPHGDPDGQRSISSSAMTPSREERVEQVMPVRVSLLKAVLILHGSRAGGGGFAQPSVYGCLAIYVAYRQSCATRPYDFSSRLGRRGHRDRPWKIRPS